MSVNNVNVMVLFLQHSTIVEISNEIMSNYCLEC